MASQTFRRSKIVNHVKRETEIYEQLAKAFEEEEGEISEFQKGVLAGRGDIIHRLISTFEISDEEIL